MSLSIQLDLSEDDLKHFRLIMQHARSTAAKLSPEDVVAGAEHLIAEIEESDAPQFVRDRLGILNLMIAMLSDIDWRLPPEDSDRVLNALTYFAEPEDLIPDTIPGIGYLDDAIMIEVVVRELRMEIDTYADFCEYREAQREKDPNTRVDREAWLAARREALTKNKKKLSSNTATMTARKLFSRK
jgi:uncharacterized membrane protein YkvA (DUF1232 family)